MSAIRRSRRCGLALGVAAVVGVVACSGLDTSGDGGPYAGATSQPHDQVPGQLPDTLQHVLEAELLAMMDQYQVPGAAIAMTTPEGAWSTVVGVTDLESQEPLAKEMAWPLRSLTKSVVVTVLLQLVDEGALALDDTIQTYIPDVPNGEEITLLQLANMTSGVGDYTHSESFIETLIDDPTQQFTLEELNNYGLAEGSQFAPGTDHVYSNTSTNLLAVVIEDVTGKPIAESIDERIVDELNLAGTSYANADEDWQSPHAQGHQFAEGEVTPIFNNFSSMGASGAMISTLADMTVWAEALGSGQLISPILQQERLVGAPLTQGPEYDEYAGRNRRD